MFENTLVDFSLNALENTLLEAGRTWGSAHVALEER